MLVTGKANDPNTALMAAFIMLDAWHTHIGLSRRRPLF
jgi:hypothetical protein